MKTQSSFFLSCPNACCGVAGALFAIVLIASSHAVANSREKCADDFRIVAVQINGPDWPSGSAKRIGIYTESESGLTERWFNTGGAKGVGYAQGRAVLQMALTGLGTQRPVDIVKTVSGTCHNVSPPNWNNKWSGIKLDE